MSVRYTSYVLDHSPYKAGHLLVHLVMADYARDDGTLWPSQEALAERARCSVRHLKQVIRDMVRDGFLLVSRKGRRNFYRLLAEVKSMPEQGNPSSHGKEPIGEPQIPCIEPPQSKENHQPLPDPRRGQAGSNGLESFMPVVGAFGDDGDGGDEHRVERRARKKRRRDGGTNFHDCVAEFSRLARQYGHREFNVMLVRRSVKDLRDEHGLEYESIKELVGMFFTRFEIRARSADNIATLWRYCIPQLLRSEQRAQEAYGETQSDWEKLLEYEQAKKKRSMEQLLRRNRA